MKKHKKFMKIAYNLAKSVKGNTSPNPAVGAIIVKKGKIICNGVTQECGKNHAEVEAIQNAGDTNLTGATLYVTLEPCCVCGHTPPCTDLIIEKKFKKVVVGTLDPNPKVNCNGINILKENGIKIKVGVYEKKIKKLNEDFEKYITTGYPFITGKYAMTLDGKMATKNGSSKWISNAKSRKYVHKLRSKTDCILVGKNTVLNDNPTLNVRLVQSERNPVRIILDTFGEINENYSVMTDNLKTIFVVNNRVDKKFIELCHSYNKDVLVDENSDSDINLDWLMKELAKKGFCSVLVEGGSKVFNSLVEKKLLDKIICFVAPKILTGDKITPFSGEGLYSISQAYRLTEVKSRKFDNDFMISGYLNYDNIAKSYSIFNSRTAY